MLSKMQEKLNNIKSKKKEKLLPCLKLLMVFKYNLNKIKVVVCYDTNHLSFSCYK